MGREPCTKNMNLKEINVEMDENGRILVNEANQTSVRNIFAVGDIIEDKLQLTPVAIQQGKLLAQVITSVYPPIVEPLRGTQKQSNNQRSEKSPFKYYTVNISIKTHISNNHSDKVYQAKLN